MELSETRAKPAEETVPSTISLEVLQTIKEAQRQHGIRHSDYQRYRQYCSRKLRRVRKVVNFPQGTKHKVHGKMIPAELVKEPRCLIIPLMSAERSWAYSMQLKYEANTEPRKAFHMRRRLKKAVQHAEHLQGVAVEGAISCDARTILEIKSYCAWMKGLLAFEYQQWEGALDLFRTSKLICEKLCEALVGEAKELYVARGEEMNPNIKYCEYVIGGDASAVEDLRKMRLHVAVEDPLTSKLDELIEKTREKESATLSEVSWLGRTVAVKVPLVRKAITHVLEQRDEAFEGVSEGGVRGAAKKDKGGGVVEGEEQRLLMLEGVLKEVIDAQQALKDEHKEDTVLKAVSTKSQLPDEKLTDAAYLFTYLIFLRQTTSIERSLLMIKQMKKPQEAKVKSQDFARLYDVVIQNLSDISSCPGIQADLLEQVNNLAIAYKAFKCFYLADLMNGLRRFADSMALYHRCLTYAGLFKIPHHLIDPQLNKITPSSDDLTHLSEEAEVLRYSAHASCILDAPSNEAAAATTTSPHDKPLIDRLHEYRDATSSGSNKRIIHLPPAFEPTCAKPFFFDLALSMVELPSLEHLLEQKQSQSSITGYFKKWIWGGGDKASA